MRVYDMYNVSPLRWIGTQDISSLWPYNIWHRVESGFFLTLPEDRQGLVSYSFLLSSSSFFFFLPCRRSRRVLFLTRFFFLLLLLLLLLSSSSSSFFWQHIFFTHFPTSDFDQTCSQWPVPWPLLRHRQWWGQGSRWGHWGQKGHFHQKGIKSYRILSIDTGVMHMQ